MRNVWEKSKKCSFLLAVLLLLVFQTTAFAKDKPVFTKSYEIVDGADGYFIAKNGNEKYGLLDEEGEESIPFEYDEMQFPDDTDRYEYVKVKQNDAWGILKYDGKAIIKVSYKDVCEYQNDNEIASAYNGNTTELFSLKGKKQEKELSGQYTVVSDDVFVGTNSDEQKQEDIKNEKDNTLINLAENNLVQEQKDKNGKVKKDKKILKMGECYVAQKYLPDGQHTQVAQLDIDSYVEIYQKNDKKADVMPEEDWGDTKTNTTEQVSLKLIRVVSDHSILLKFEKKADEEGGYYVIYSFDADNDKGTFSERYEKVGNFTDGKAFAVTKDDKKLYIIDEDGKRGDKEVSISKYESDTNSLTDTANTEDAFVTFKKDDKQYKLYSLLKGKEEKGVWKKVTFLKHGYVLLCNEDDEYGIIDKDGKTVVKYGEFSQEELKKAYCSNSSVTVVKDNADKQQEVYYYQAEGKQEEGFFSKYKVIILGAAIVLLLIIIVLLVVLIRGNKKKKREEEERRKKQQNERIRRKPQSPIYNGQLHNDRNTKPLYDVNPVQTPGGRIVSEKAAKPQSRPQPKPQSKPQPASVVPPKIKQPTGYLKGIKGVFAGRTIPIKSGSYIRIGRSQANNEIVLNSPKVSRTHCVVEYDARRRKYRVIDYSSNGTWLMDGRRLVKNQENWLDEGTILVIGNDENVFELGRN